jgi:hypothetical protein
MKPKPAPQSEIILYQTEDGQTRIQCRFEQENVWMTQALMAELFQVTVPTVNEHLKGIYAENELPAEATIRKFRMVRRAGPTCKDYLHVPCLRGFWRPAHE